MKKIVTVVGARPQFIKAAAVSHALGRCHGLDEVLVHTGQHYDANMSDVFFSELGIQRPDFELEVGGGSHGRNTGRMLMAIEEVLVAQCPDCVLVYGDTDSTLAGALAAAKLNIPLVHVEAGLRSFNKRMPEEVNRCLTDHVSSLLLTPTDAAVENLAHEGISGSHVVNVGDVMYDVALAYGARAEAISDVLRVLNVNRGEYILATVHRQENTDSAGRLRNIFSAFAGAWLPVVLPLHPRTRKCLAAHGIGIPGNVIVTEPLGYLDMVLLEKGAALVATDSGGVQKEAYFHGVPCVTLRDETEWLELVEMGWNTLASPQRDDLSDFFRGPYSPGGGGARPYGDGAAADKIVESILRSI